MSTEWGSWTGPRPAGARRGLWLAALWSLAVLVSAAQIYVREAHAGAPAPWAAVLVANLWAWLPWLLLAPAALRLERRFPLAGAGRRRHAAIHLALAVGVAAAFLLYLAIFHLVYLERQALTLAGLAAEYGEQLGRFFMTATALYLVIVVAGFAEQAWRGQRRERLERQELATGAAPALRKAPLVVRSAGRIERIDPGRVRWIAAEGNYARLCLEGRSVLHRRGLASLARELAAQRFVRIHRSTIVNLRYARTLERRTHGDAVLVLRDGSRLKVSRTYRKGLERNGF